MNDQEFREFGKAMIDFVAEYNEKIRERDVLPSVQPGYMSQMLPTEAPEQAEKWQDVMKDIERVIMPGITHWNSPNFHAYYPTANSYPAIVGEILSAGLGVIGFSWIASPACTELEVIAMNWLGKMLGLPEQFLNCGEGPGGGVLQGSASETILVGLLAARDRTVRRVKAQHPDWEEADILPKLVAYSSDQSNSCVEKTGILGAMQMRLLAADENCCLRGETVLKAIEKDVQDGLIPCYLVATLGTTGTCAFDNLEEIGPVCRKYNVWLHIDAAYAGAAFVCPEYRHLMAGVEHADSFNFNPHKWLLTNFECSALWVQDARNLVDAFSVDRIYLDHNNKSTVPDYRHWQISLGRRFRSLKLWFVMRLYGITGLQNHIRNSIKVAEHFVQLVREDERFEICPEPNMGLVCFRIKGEDSHTQKLVDRLTERKKIYVVRATYHGKLIVRFAICSRHNNIEDNNFAWTEITTLTSEILNDNDKSSKKTLISKVSIEPKKNDGQLAARLKDLEFKNRNEKLLK